MPRETNFNLTTIVTSTSHNLTTTSSNTSPYADATCCYLDSVGVVKLIWYSSSINVTVKTVSTTVYQYDNTAVTSLKTVLVNNTLPTGLFQSPELLSNYPEVPTSMIAGNGGGYPSQSILVIDTAYTDPYGVVYQSPTPVWIYQDVTSVSQFATPSNGVPVCPPADFEKIPDGREEKIYPSGMSSFI